MSPRRQAARLFLVAYFLVASLLLLGISVQSRHPLFMAGIALLGAAAVGNGLASKRVGTSLLMLGGTWIVFAWSTQLTSPTVLSVDPWGHQHLVSRILSEGRVPAQSDFISRPYPWTDLWRYTKLPGMHLEQATVDLFTGLDTKWGALWGIGFPSLLLVILAVANIGRRWSTSGAVMAAGLVALADNVLDLTARNIVPNTMGSALALCTFAVLLGKPRHWQWVGFLLAGSVLVIHSLSFAFVGTFAALTVLEGLTHRDSVALRRSLLFAAGSVVAGFAFWNFVEPSYFENVVGIGESVFTVGLSVKKYSARVAVPYVYIVLARLGMILFFVALGSLVMARWKRLATERGLQVFAVASCLVAGIGVAAFLTPSLSGVAHRFWFLGQLLGGIVMGSMLMGRSPTVRPIAGAVGIGLVMVLGFASLTDGLANNDNPLATTYVPATGLSLPEMTLARGVSDKAQSPVQGDLYFGSRTAYFGMPDRFVRQTSDPATLANSTSLSLFRPTAMEGRAMVFGNAYSPITYSFTAHDVQSFKRAIDAHRSIIWDTGTALAHVPVTSASA